VCAPGSNIDSAERGLEGGRLATSVCLGALSSAGPLGALSALARPRPTIRRPPIGRPISGRAPGRKCPRGKEREKEASVWWRVCWWPSLWRPRVGEALYWLLLAAPARKATRFRGARRGSVASSELPGGVQRASQWRPESLRGA